MILEPHNFARYYPDTANFQSSAQGLIGSYYPNSVFSNFWWRVADIYKTNNHVIFNLMNEPNSMPTEQWVAAANTAIAGIRATGATNLIHLPGNQWTGANAWTANYYGTPNSVAMLNIVDPGSNYVFEVHQYLDTNSSGTSTNIVNADIGVTRLTAFTTRARSNNKRGFLGEFAVANSTIGGTGNLIGDEALTNMLSHIAANSDVWEGRRGGRPGRGGKLYVHPSQRIWERPINKIKQPWPSCAASSPSRLQNWRSPTTNSNSRRAWVSFTNRKPRRAWRVDGRITAPPSPAPDRRLPSRCPRERARAASIGFL